MNIDRLTYIAQWLEAGAPHLGKVQGFNISVGIKAISSDPECGTVCCIAGAATQFFNDEDGYLVRRAIEDIDSAAPSAGEAPWDLVFIEAMNLLDLTEDQATALFIPVGESNSLSLDGVQRYWSDFNDPIKAAKVIRNFIETNEVNWDV